MIILDTNIVSALMLREPDAVIVSWLDGQEAESIWTTAITVFEIRFGLALLPSGRRRRALEEVFSRAMSEDFDGRVLPFEDEAARRAAELAAHRRLAGRPVDFRDVEIAGIVAAKSAILATRNTRHFEDLGIELLNPWKTSQG
jgi:predicted nucleic acid-binding protein